MNSNFKRRVIAGLFVPVIGLAAGTVLAQGTTSMGSGAAGNASWNAQTFDSLDKNRDGRISREEAQADATMRDSWTKMDATNRGSVSKDEFEKYRTMQPGATGAAGTSPPPNSGTATPSMTHPAVAPSSGSTNSGSATPSMTHPAVAPSSGSTTTK